MPEGIQSIGEHWRERNLNGGQIQWLELTIYGHCCRLPLRGQEHSQFTVESATCEVDVGYVW